MRKLLPALLVMAAPAFASGAKDTAAEGTAFLPNGTLTYEVFEATIEHVDLEGCPEQFDPDVVFCRMTLASDMAHVFAFGFEGAQPLMAVKSYELTDGFLPF